MRIIVGAQCGIWNRYFAHRCYRRRAGGLARQPTMQPQGLGNLFTDSENRIERGHRILKNHGDVIAAHVAHLAVGKPEQIFSVKENFPADDFPRRRDQPHDRQRGHRFATAALAHQAQ